MLEVGWWGGDLSKNILKQGMGKGKICSLGGGSFEDVTTPKKELKRTQYQS